MRIKLNFHIDSINLTKSDEIDNFLSKYKKIIFPVNYNGMTYISDLKQEILDFVMRKSDYKKHEHNYSAGLIYDLNLRIESLSLNGFLLLEEFELCSLLNNDDEISVNLVFEALADNDEDSDCFKTNKTCKTAKTDKTQINNECISKEKRNIDTKKISNYKLKKVSFVQIDTSESESENSSLGVHNKVDSLPDNNKLLGRKLPNRTNLIDKYDTELTIQTKKEIVNKGCVTKFIADSESESDSEDKSILINTTNKNGKESTQSIITQATHFFSRDKSEKYNKNYSKAEPKFNFQGNPSQNYLKEVDRVNLNTIELNYDLVAADKLDDIKFLRGQFHILFQKGTRIIFRILELSMKTGGPAASGYKKGTIEEFIPEFKCFVIKLADENIDEGLLDVYGTRDEYETNIISVHLKDFIELRVEKSVRNTTVTETEVKEDAREILNIEVYNNVENTTDKSEVTKILDNKIDDNKFDDNLNPNITLPTAITPTSANINNEQPKISTYNKIVLPYIKKQVEFYFSDKNYYKDAFLLEKAALDENNYIYLDIIMGFNKLKALSNKKEEIFTALKDSDIIEFSEDKTKIRKKKLIKEFM